MARIRSIKPEFWRSPSTASASPWARLLYIAMWNWADDFGVGEWTPRELLGFAFPNDPQITNAEFQSLCTEVATCFGAQFYMVRGRRYYAIPAWDEHQKNERRAKGKYPGPDDPESTPDQEFAEMRGNTVPTHGKTPAGTGEQGNRGTGEQTPVRGESSSPPKKQPSDFEKHINEVTNEAYAAIDKAANFMALRGIAKWCVKDRGLNSAQFRDVCTTIFAMGKPITRQTVGQLIDGHLNQPPATTRPSRDQRNMEFVASLGQQKGIES